MQCTLCKGRGWCGRPCIVYERLHNLESTISRIRGTDLFGATPPSVFVGRFNYPNVQAGILVPPDVQDSQHLDFPELWKLKNRTIPEIIGYRNQLVNSRFRAHVKRRNSFLDHAQEVALADRPVDAEATLRKAPSYRLLFNSSHLPIGAHADLTKFRLTENPSVPQKVDYLVGDTDAKSLTTMSELFDSGISTTHIQRLLSIGLLGKKSQRRMVPTRWAITATDSAVANKLRDKIYDCETVNKVELYTADYLGNYFKILFLPRPWQFELIESHLRGSAWAPQEDAPLISDYESVFGRTKYASTTAGAYYAAKLAVLENLSARRRQASVLIVREITPEYYAPVGVWVIREAVRAAFENSPKEFETVEEALTHIKPTSRISITKIKAMSTLLKNYKQQKTLNEYNRKT